MSRVIVSSSLRNSQTENTKKRLINLSKYADQCSVDQLDARCVPPGALEVLPAGDCGDQMVWHCALELLREPLGRHTAA